MHGSLHRRHRATFLLLAVVAAFSLNVSPAFAQGWALSASYGSRAECLAAGSANPRGAEWKCVVSTAKPGGYDLYLWG
jgi:hypothetical protein